MPAVIPKRNLVPALLLTAGLVAGIANDTYANARVLEQVEMGIAPICTDTTGEVKQTDLPEVIVTGAAMKRKHVVMGAVSVVSFKQISTADTIDTIRIPVKKRKWKSWF